MKPSDPNHPLSLPRPQAHARPGVADPTPMPPQLAPGGAFYSAEPPVPAHAAQGATLGGVLQALRRRWLLAVTVALAGAALAVVAVFSVMPARYVAQARLKLTSRADEPQFLPRQHDAEPAVWKGNQEAILKSPNVLERALGSESVKPFAISREPVDWLEKALKVDFLLGPEIMRITLSADDPEGVAELLNAVCDSYLAAITEQEQTRRKEILLQLEDSEKTYRRRLSALEVDLANELKMLKRDDPRTFEMKMANAISRRESLAKEARDLEADIAKRKRDLARLEERLKALATERVEPTRVNKLLAESPYTQELQREMAMAQKRIDDIKALVRNPKFLEEQLAGPTETLNRYRKAYADLKQLLLPMIEEQLRAEVGEVLRADISKVSGEIDGLKSLEAGVTAAVKKNAAEVAELEQASLRRTPLLDKLQGDIAQVNEALKNLTKKVADFRVEPAAPPRVFRLQTAQPPKERDYSRPLKFAGAAGIGVFGLLLFGVALLEFRSRKVSGAGEVTQGLGLPVLGTLPSLPARLRRPVAGPQPGASGRDLYYQSLLTESVDAIRTLLLHHARSDSLQVILVSSAVGGEGKTSVASQLAASLARAWRKTLLIDGDLRNPACHKLFDVPQEPGLSEVLRGELGLTDAVRPTTLSRLWLLPAGQWDSHAVQALAQEGVGTMFDQLKEHYEFIIVDSCPVLPVADSLLLAQHADGVVFSVLRDVSRLPAVQAAHAKLAALGARTLGAVVIGGGDDVGALAYNYAPQARG